MECDEVESPEQVLSKCMNSSIIVAATITDFKQGISTMSFPPQCHYPLTLSKPVALRGVIPSGDLKIIIEGSA